ncbi:MAG: hypothetical protein Kow0079_00800 [Vicingaceae bacterium]
MKKIYLLALSFLTIGAFAQTKTGVGPIAHPTNMVKPINKQAKAVGDTVFFYDSRYTALFMNTNDANDFQLNFEDIDQNAPSSTYAGAGFTSDWMNFYSLNNIDKLPGDVDTAWFFGATSWFATPAQADNWLSMGPITIPASGAELSWYEKFNPQWTDAYDVYIVTSVADMNTGAQAYVDVNPGVDVPLYTKTGIYGSPSQPASDTIFNKITKQIPQYAGQRIWIVFHHNANDGDMLFLDHFMVTEQNNVGINELDNTNRFSVFPNPALDYITISSKVNQTFDIYDITGKKMLSISTKTLNTKIDVSSFSKGVYFVQSNTGEVKKLIIK